MNTKIRLMFVVAALSTGACDEVDPMASDAGTPVIDDGPEKADGGPVATLACKTGATTLTRAEFGEMTAASGQCGSPEDLDLLCAKDLNALNRSCGTSCYVTSPKAPEAELKACTISCLTPQAKLSEGCLGCFAQTVACTLAGGKCVGSCSINPFSPGCIQCQNTNGCLAAFFACSGLPVPAALRPDGETGADASLADAAAEASAENAGADVSQEDLDPGADAGGDPGDDAGSGEETADGGAPSPGSDAAADETAPDPPPAAGPATGLAANHH